MDKIKKKRAALHNLGCKVNAYETEAMRQLLEEAGYEIVDFSETADVYVVNTCSVTNIADRKSRQMLRRARRQNPDGILAAAGCYVQTKTEDVRKDADVDIMIGNNKKRDLVRMIEEFEADRKKTEAVAPIHQKQPYEELKLDRTAEHTRAFLKIQDGCNQFCSYCVIPYARGRARSRAFPEILEEAERLSANGCQEVVLTGIHLSSYGTDTGESLIHLIRETAKIKGIRRIRLGSLEPMIVTEAFAEKLSKIDKICPHFHLSLQSGCDATLKRMNRKYSTEEYKRSCEFLRKHFSHPAITTDVIVGFPGETEEEFSETELFLKEMRFYEMHIFKYSRREGTKAAALPEQVSEQVKAKRSERLIALADEMSEEFRRHYLGKETEALMEEPFEYNGRRYFAGYTKEYVKVALETEADMSNSFVKGKVADRLCCRTYLMVEF